MKVAFFGHRDTPSTIKFELINCIISLIENDSADSFYVGNQGAFDGMVRNVLYDLKLKYPHISINIVLAYLPKNKEEDYIEDSLYPEGLEKVPPKFAILKRNQIMLTYADCVVVYVKHPFGGAAKFKELAEKANKQVINLADIDQNPHQLI